MQLYHLLPVTMAEDPPATWPAGKLSVPLSAAILTSIASVVGMLKEND